MKNNYRDLLGDVLDSYERGLITLAEATAKMTDIYTVYRQKMNQTSLDCSLTCLTSDAALRDLTAMYAHKLAVLCAHKFNKDE